jgi:phage virion morphogenesis protein
MSGISMRVDVQDNAIRHELTRLIALGKNPAEAMRDIATYGAASTRERFKLQIDPDGNRWKPSLRVQLRGGLTLTKDGHLGNSITSRSSRAVAEWGSNRVYAGIQHFGGVIKPKAGGSLRFRLASGAFVTAKEVTLPARAYIGVNDENGADILDLLQHRVEGRR